MPIYENRGVSADKRLVMGALAGTSRSIVPGAFCQAVPDVFTGSDAHCVLLHADGAGTKSALAYLWWRETGDATVFRGIAEDSLVMNLDDLLCVGATGPFVLSNLIGRNAKLVPETIVSEIVRGYLDIAERLMPFGIEIISCGGETADVGDLVRTIVVDSVVATRMRRDELLNVDDVKPGLDIVAFGGFGQTPWEREPNSGIGTNGFTAARHEVLDSHYRDRYPESYDPAILEFAYTGEFCLQDALPDDRSMTVGKALLSPTRTYAPFIKKLLDQPDNGVRGIIHNSGGGLTKCLNFGSAIRYVKDDLFDLPPVYKLVERVAPATLLELVSVFNLGQRMEVYCEPSATDAICSLATGMNMPAKVIGRTEQSDFNRELILSLRGETVELRR